MKHLHSTARFFAILFALALLLAPMAALAEGAWTTQSPTTQDPSTQTLTSADIWGVLRGGETVYRDMQGATAWGQAPRDMIVHVTAYGSKVAIVKNGSKTGYVALSSLKTISAGTMLQTSKNTRVYQAPSLKSRYLNVPKGLEVELMALNGNCAMVRRGEYIGYMYIAHFVPAQ